MCHVQNVHKIFHILRTTRSNTACGEYPAFVVTLNMTHCSFVGGSCVVQNMRLRMRIIDNDFEWLR